MRRDNIEKERIRFTRSQLQNLWVTKDKTESREIHKPQQLKGVIQGTFGCFHKLYSATL